MFRSSLFLHLLFHPVQCLKPSISKIIFAHSTSSTMSSSVKSGIGQLSVYYNIFEDFTPTYLHISSHIILSYCSPCRKFDLLSRKAHTASFCHLFQSQLPCCNCSHVSPSRSLRMKFCFVTNQMQVVSSSSLQGIGKVLKSRMSNDHTDGRTDRQRSLKKSKKKPFIPKRIKCYTKFVNQVDWH